METYISFLASQQPRCDVNSPVRFIDKNICRKIIGMTIVTINEYIELLTSLNINKCIVEMNNKIKIFGTTKTLSMIGKLFKHVNRIFDYDDSNLNEIRTIIEIINNLRVVTLCSSKYFCVYNDVYDMQKRMKVFY